MRDRIRPKLGRTRAERGQNFSAKSGRPKLVDLGPNSAKLAGYLPKSLQIPAASGPNSTRLGTCLPNAAELIYFGRHHNSNLPETCQHLDFEDPVTRKLLQVRSPDSQAVCDHNGSPSRFEKLPKHGRNREIRSRDTNMAETGPVGMSRRAESRDGTPRFPRQRNAWLACAPEFLPEPLTAARRGSHGTRELPK